MGQSSFHIPQVALLHAQNAPGDGGLGHGIPEGVAPLREGVGLFNPVKHGRDGIRSDTACQSP